MSIPHCFTSIKAVCKNRLSDKKLLYFHLLLRFFSVVNECIDRSTLSLITLQKFQLDLFAY